MKLSLITFFLLATTSISCSSDAEREDKRLFGVEVSKTSNATLGDGAKYKVSNVPVSRPICAYSSKLTGGGLLLDIYLSETSICLPGNGYVPPLPDTSASESSSSVSVKAGCLAQEGKNESAELNINLTSDSNSISKGRKTLKKNCSLASVQIKDMQASQEYCLYINYKYADVFTDTIFETKKICFQAGSEQVPEFVFSPRPDESEDFAEDFPLESFTTE